MRCKSHWLFAHLMVEAKAKFRLEEKIKPFPYTSSRCREAGAGGRVEVGSWKFGLSNRGPREQRKQDVLRPGQRADGEPGGVQGSAL